MSSFTNFDAGMSIIYDPHASEVLKGDYWRVGSAFSYYVGNEADGVTVWVPEGYLTDGASVPRALWSLIPPWGRYGQAVVVHDILCEYLTVTEKGLPVRISRLRADQILNEALGVLGVNESTRNEIVMGVDLYRIATGKNTPTNDPAKRALEAEWFNKNELLAGLKTSRG